AADPAFADVKVKALKGVVTLNGKVDSKLESDRAQDTAQSVAGVVRVKNLLKVSEIAGTSASAGTSTGAVTTPDVDKQAAGNQGVNPTASGAPAAETTPPAGPTQGNTSA